MMLTCQENHRMLQGVWNAVSRRSEVHWRHLRIITFSHQHFKPPGKNVLFSPFHSSQHLYLVPPPKKKNEAKWLICSMLQSINVVCLASSYKASPDEKNGTEIIEFGLVVLLLWSFLETQSFSNLFNSWERMDRKFTPCDHSYMLFCSHWCMVSPTAMYERPQKADSLTLNLRKWTEIWKWLCFRKWPSNQNYTANIHDNGIILFRKKILQQKNTQKTGNSF